MDAPIEYLPVEVCDIITSDFDLLSYQQLRLSSPRLYSLSFSNFAKRYFSELKTTLGSPSLDRLVDISGNAYLCNAIKLLDITLLSDRDYKLLVNITRVGRFPPPMRFPEVHGVRPANIPGESTLYNDVVAQNHLGCIIDRLASCLKALSNLKAIRFRTRQRAPIEYRTAMLENNRLFRTRCFQAIVQAISKSKIQLEEFSMGKQNNLTSLRHCADIPISTLLSPLTYHPLQHCFINLQSLTLSLVTAFDVNPHGTGWEKSLSQLITYTPNLKNLILSLDHEMHVSHKDSAKVFSIFASVCRLPALESFHLVNCSLHEVDLAAFITAHEDTLCQLIFRHVRQLSGSWVSFWETLKAVKRLRCLRLISLEGPGFPIIFQGKAKVRLKAALEAKPLGKPMCSLLDDLITSYTSGDISLFSGHPPSDGLPRAS
ncbi:hypothetical protein GQ44DRAFT_693552 [Phaeosphaeriaceae sp. PMI808]|nr:hypothetical protein GQ44DRAFT_693552 [Phaeosphaeriaceae sp. PMI808]